MTLSKKKKVRVKAQQVILDNGIDKTNSIKHLFLERFSQIRKNE
jgi:hypothetical protein